MTQHQLWAMEFLNSETIRCLWTTFQVLYQGPGSLRVLGSVPSNALFWTEISDVVPGNCWSHQSSLGVAVPSAPISTGTSIALMFFLVLPSFWCYWHHQFVSLDLEVPQDLNPLVLNHLWRCLPSSPWDLNSILSTDISVYYRCYLVVVFHVCFACQHLPPCCDALYCFRSIIAQP